MSTCIIWIPTTNRRIVPPPPPAGAMVKLYLHLFKLETLILAISRLTLLSFSVRNDWGLPTAGNLAQAQFSEAS